MKKLLVLVIAVLFAFQVADMAQGRTWTDAKGKKVSADFVSLIQDGEPKVKLQTPSGKIIVAPLRNFSKEDQEYIRFEKRQNQYVWALQPRPFVGLAKKIEWLKKNRLWGETRDYYIEKKNNNTDPNKHSRSIFAETINEMYDKN